MKSHGCNNMSHKMSKQQCLGYSKTVQHSFNMCKTERWQQRCLNPDSLARDATVYLRSPYHASRRRLECKHNTNTVTCANGLWYTSKHDAIAHNFSQNRCQSRHNSNLPIGAVQERNNNTMRCHSRVCTQVNLCRSLFICGSTNTSQQQPALLHHFIC